MRKLAVSVVTLTALTACTQGDDLGSTWSFELPENSITDDEQFARFGEQVGRGDDSGIASVEPAPDEPLPSFTEDDSAPSTVPTAPTELGDASAPLVPNDALSPTDLSMDELVEFTFPQRGPRPNPLARVRFSPTGPQASNRYIERIIGAADDARQSRPVSVSLVAPRTASISEPIYLQPVNLQDQSTLNNAIGGPAAELTEPNTAIQDTLSELPPPPSDPQISQS